MGFIGAIRLELSGTPRQSAALKHTHTLLYIIVAVKTAGICNRVALTGNGVQSGLVTLFMRALGAFGCHVSSGSGHSWNKR